MLDFAPSASLEWIDLSENQIKFIENVDKNLYLRHLYLDRNEISKVENLSKNQHMRVLSLNSNKISKIENIDGMHLEELYLAEN
jgi:protein phosphatase 1 regulatory subunit 7